MELKAIANDFATKIVGSEFGTANQMLSPELREDWSVEALKVAYEEMIEYFEGAPVRVITDFDESIGMTKVDEGTFVYVPLESEGGVEAVSD